MQASGLYRIVRIGNYLDQSLYTRIITVVIDDNILVTVESEILMSVLLFLTTSVMNLKGIQLVF